MKVAITVPTGRTLVRKVVASFLDNAESHGHDIRNFSIYLSIDTSYKGTNIEEFFLDEDLVKKVARVVYIDEVAREKIGIQMTERAGISSQTASALFVGRGYSKQRNAALMQAVLDGNDIAICLDDDEYPFLPIRKRKGILEWKEQDFFTPHIDELMNGADITRGPYLGYNSPIPSDFERDVPEEIRVKLGAALQIGNDVIHRRSFLKLMNTVKYLSDGELSSKKAFEVVSGKHGKHVYAGNMGINLESLRNGRIPIFFTPPNARGEDTIFALQLDGASVREVPAYIFHDPFCMYSEILEGIFPERLAAVPVTEETLQRFSSALIGWLRYAPILIKMTTRDERSKKKKLLEMRDKIEHPTNYLADLFGIDEFRASSRVLQEYADSVDEHHSELMNLQVEWRTRIVPSIL